MNRVTESDVRTELEPDEPDYQHAARLGPGALPVLERLVMRSRDQVETVLAAKAAYLAGLIAADSSGSALKESTRVLSEAAAHPDPRVRLSVAHVMRFLPAHDSEDVLARLIDDMDSSVRKFSLLSVKPEVGPEVRASVKQRLFDADPDVRHAAEGVMDRVFHDVHGQGLQAE